MQELIELFANEKQFLKTVSSNDCQIPVWADSVDGIVNHMWLLRRRA